MILFPAWQKRKAAKRAAILGLLGVYLFALVFLPVLHVHGTCCTTDESTCCCGHSDDDASGILSAADDCDLCRILHTSVPLVNGSPAILERPFEVPGTPLLSVFHATVRFGIPSSRGSPSV